MAEKPAPAEHLDALLLQVGRLNYSWTNTESLLIHLIAGLAKTDKERATIIFLTLNTTRARVDLVERLAKLDTTPGNQKASILDFTTRMMKFSALRNRYSHSIYAFDPVNGEARTIMMRIADRKDNIKLGRSDQIDDVAIDDIGRAINSISDLNKVCWRLIREFDFPL